MSSLASKAVIITGASTGIGAATALKFASLGAQVSLVARRQSKLETVAQKCSDAGAKDVLVLNMDLTYDNAPWEVIQQTTEKFKGLDVLINNAGIAKFSPLSNTKVEDFQKSLDTNLIVPFLLTKEALPYLKKSSGNVVFVSTVSGIKPFYGLGEYGISKAALSFMSKCFALEEAKNGVRCNTLSPGTIDTDIWRNQVDLAKKYPSTDALMTSMSKRIPIGHLGTPEMCANVIAFLASKEGEYFNGAEIVCDGGLSITTKSIGKS